MKINRNEYELLQLFGIYFSQDFDLFFDYDPKQSFLSQAVNAYKKDHKPSSDKIYKCIREIREILSHNYSEQQLENEIIPLYGIPSNPDFFKLNHREFLEKVVEELER